MMHLCVYLGFQPPRILTIPQLEHDRIRVVLERHKHQPLASRQTDRIDGPPTVDHRPDPLVEAGKREFTLDRKTNTQPSRWDRASMDAPQQKRAGVYNQSGEGYGGRVHRFFLSELS